MDLDRIREFHAVAKTLNFTQAARGLSMSVSALSKHVQALEAEVDAPLITRGLNGGQASLTEAGKVFLNETGPWLDQYQAIIEKCRELKQPDPPARIHGVTASIYNMTGQVSRVLRSHGKGHVGVACVGTTLPAREALDRDVADFAAFYEPEPRVRWIEDDEAASRTYGAIALAPERLYAVVGVGNEAYEQDVISLAQIERCPNLLMSNALYNNWLNASEELFRRRGCKLANRIVGDGPLYGDAFPLGARNITVVQAKFAEYYRNLDVEDVRILDIEGDPVIIHCFLVYRKDTASPAARTIVETFEDQGIG